MMRYMAAGWMQPNRYWHRELMIADRISKPLKGVEFRFHQTDSVTGNRVVQTVAADAGDKLRDAIEEAATSIN